MTDGADYLGYPEPEPEPELGWKSKLKRVGIALIRGFFYLFSLIVASVKMVLSGVVGALLALHLDRTFPEGISADAIWIIVLIFVFSYAAYHHLENSIEDTDLPSYE